MLRLWSNKAMNPPDSASLRPRVMAGVSQTGREYKHGREAGPAQLSFD
jgi:hypothetical protein